MTFNPEDYGIERIGRKHACIGNRSGKPYIRKSFSSDGRYCIYVRLNSKLTDEFEKVFGQYVGVGFINGNLMFYPEDDLDYAVSISCKDKRHKHTAQINIPKSMHERLNALYGDDFMRVPCNWVRHILGGHTCFEFVGEDIIYKKQVVA